MPKIITERIIDTSFAQYRRGAGLSRDEIQAMINDALGNAGLPPGTTVPDVIPLPDPTIDDIIRGSAGPFGPFAGVGGIDSEGTTSFDFTIPDWVVEGDVMVMFIANLTDHTEAYVISEGSFGWGVSGTGGSHTGWLDYDSNSSTTDEASSTPVQKVGIEYLRRIATDTDAGTEYTFTFGGTPTTYYYYFLVFSGTYISDLFEISSGNNDIDGYSEAGQANFYTGSVTIAGDNSGLVVTGAIQGNVRATPPANYRELVDIGNSDVSMYLMIRMANAGATGIINAYMDDAGAFFASLGSEAQPAV